MSADRESDSKRQPNFTYLLLGLLVTLLLGPICAELIDPDGAYANLFKNATNFIIQASFSLTLIIGIWSFIESRVWFSIGVVLAIIAVGSTVIEAVSADWNMDLVTMVAILAFCMLTVVIATLNVIRSKRMDRNQLTAAICIYLLLGIILAILNMIVLKHIPGSFKGISPDVQNGLDMIYFTFVTMTTLGYGDISPVGPLARALAYMAAVAGQFYVALLVGMMVGQYIRQKPDED